MYLHYFANENTNCVGIRIDFKINFQFAEGKWYALEKFGTHELKCLTYDFGVNGYGFKQVVQKSVSKTLDRLSLANYHTAKGNLDVPSSSQPANMVVRFNTSQCTPLFICLW